MRIEVVASYLEGSCSAKVKVCGWRMCSDILLTEANLIKKQVRMESLCLQCDVALEMRSHVLNEYNFARVV